MSENIKYISILIAVTIQFHCSCYGKYPDEKRLWRVRVSSSLWFQGQFGIDGKSRQGLKEASHTTCQWRVERRRAHKASSQLAFSLLRWPRTQTPGMVPLTSGWVFPCEPTKLTKSLPGMPPDSADLENLLLRFSSWVVLHCVKWTIKTGHHSIHVL